MQNLDDLIKVNKFFGRLETDMYFPGFADRLEKSPVEMERIGLGIWNVLPVKIDNLALVLLCVPKDGQDSLGTTAFFQLVNGMKTEAIAGILLRLQGRENARFMTPDGLMVVPKLPSFEPAVEGIDRLRILEN